MWLCDTFLYQPQGSSYLVCSLMLFSLSFHIVLLGDRNPQFLQIFVAVLFNVVARSKMFQRDHFNTCFELNNLILSLPIPFLLFLVVFNAKCLLYIAAFAWAISKHDPKLNLKMSHPIPHPERNIRFLYGPSFISILLRISPPTSAHYYLWLVQMSPHQNSKLISCENRAYAVSNPEILIIKNYLSLWCPANTR